MRVLILTGEHQFHQILRGLDELPTCNIYLTEFGGDGVCMYNFGGPGGGCCVKCRFWAVTNDF